MPLEVFDNSMLSGFKACPRKFFYRFKKHLIKASEETLDAPILFGQAMHLAMEAWYLTKDAQQMDKAFLDYFLPFKDCDAKGLRTVEKGITILHQYRENYPLANEAFTVQEKNVEIGFVAELSKDYLYCGRIDLLVDWNLMFNGPVIIDHKFSSSKGYLCITPNHQLDGYIWGVSELTKQNVKGALLNIVYIGKGLKTNTFERHMAYRTPEDIQKWKQSTLSWLSLLSECEQKDNWPMNTGSCGAFFRDCEYKPLCVSQTTKEHDALEELYPISEWIPYPELKGEK